VTQLRQRHKDEGEHKNEPAKRPQRTKNKPLKWQLTCERNDQQSNSDFYETYIGDN